MRISDWSSDVCSSDLGAILRRDNEAELVAVAIGPLQESLAVDLISIRTIEHAALALAGRAVTLQITKVSGRRARSFLAKPHDPRLRSEEHTSELQSLMRISYAVFCLKKKTQKTH